MSVSPPGTKAVTCKSWGSANTTFFFYRTAERAVKHCRSSRYTTRGGMIKNSLTLAKQENKQTQTPQNKKQPNHRPAASVRGRVKQTVKRRWNVRSTHMLNSTRKWNSTECPAQPRMELVAHCVVVIPVLPSRNGACARGSSVIADVWFITDIREGVPSLVCQRRAWRALDSSIAVCAAMLSISKPRIASAKSILEGRAQLL